VISTAKMISYEDLDKVRTVRAAKDSGKVAADKGRKRKLSAREAEGEVEGDAQEVGPSAPIVKSNREKKARLQGPDPNQDPKPWRASVAVMYQLGTRNRKRFIARGTADR
jgi:hypothetical protein